MPLCEAEKLVELLKITGKTLSTADSCTGGLIGRAITSVPGSSEIFLGGAISYSNEVKERLLGVEEETLIAHGAVSEETAREMVTGARDLFRTSTAIAVTGIAGPGGATPTKPVGLVYIAVADGPRVVVCRNIFKGDREQVRSQTVATACDLMRELIEGKL